MTHTEDALKKIAELKSLFMRLDKNGQENILIMLRSLHFAQTVSDSSEPSSSSATPPEKHSI